jgi:hypothetical protein
MHGTIALASSAIMIALAQSLSSSTAPQIYLK